MVFAPEDYEIRSNLAKAITLLTQRNELLVVVDTDPEVFEFYDQHSKADSMQASNSILAAFLIVREKKKKEEKKPAQIVRATAWSGFLNDSDFRAFSFANRWHISASDSVSFSTMPGSETTFSFRRGALGSCLSGSPDAFLRIPWSFHGESQQPSSSNATRTST
ncbi:hypothetical protein Y032_0029g1938 [Ancylostoma ceylanicum]|uniref:Uncharacterized protein n=1 Tax=Ancylostoma ceylanicum TaxID=53326 RepID=A0A016UST1_9BILA|nr:hypothetical protein Y032_0029g1938 [Ancylostoma ceylanicum]